MNHDEDTVNRLETGRYYHFKRVNWKVTLVLVMGVAAILAGLLMAASVFLGQALSPRHDVANSSQTKGLTKLTSSPTATNPTKNSTAPESANPYLGWVTYTNTPERFSIMLPSSFVASNPMDDPNLSVGFGFDQKINLGSNSGFVKISPGYDQDGNGNYLRCENDESCYQDLYNALSAGYDSLQKIYAAIANRTITGLRVSQNNVNGVGPWITDDYAISVNGNEFSIEIDYVGLDSYQAATESPQENSILSSIRFW